MKKIGTFLLALCMALVMLLPGTSVLAADPQISLVEVSGQPGDEITVDVQMTGNPGLAYLKIRVGYDASELTLLSVTNTGLLGGMFTASQTIDVNPQVLQWVAAGNSYGDGVIATLKFKIADTATAGNKTLTLLFDECYNQNLDDVVFSVAPGTVQVAPGTEDTPVVAKHKSQVRFTEENGDLADAFDYRLISVMTDADWDAYFVDADGNVTITAVGFVAANESDAAKLADAQAAVESGATLPEGWKTASTNYIQKADETSDAYFGCIIKGIKHSEQTEDIICSAYVAYTDADGQTGYVWYDEPIVAAVATNYDAAADAWRGANA